MAALYLIGQFKSGVYGHKRLQKTMYLAERKSEHVKPFTYRRWYFGQFSDELDDVKDQLIAMGYINATPLDSATTFSITFPDGHELQTTMGGNKYAVWSKPEIAGYLQAMVQADPTLAAALSETVQEFGYLPESKLVEYCYDLPEFKAASEGDLLVESSITDGIEVGLSKDECDDLELAFSPSMIAALDEISIGLDQESVDWEKVESVELRPNGSR